MIRFLNCQTIGEESEAKFWRCDIPLLTSIPSEMGHNIFSLVASGGLLVGRAWPSENLGTESATLREVSKDIRPSKLESSLQHNCRTNSVSLNNRTLLQVRNRQGLKRKVSPPQSRCAIPGSNE
jgi:hypothetical protein